MTDLAWMPLYIGDEAAVTGHLTAEEFGAYERLRRHYWQHGNLPDDAGRLTRITGIEPERWPAVREAIGSLVEDALSRLADQRADAEAKRERKVAAGRKGARSRWRSAEADGKRNAVANGKRMAEPLANALPNQWPPAPAPDEERYEEGLVPTRMHARETIPSFGDRVRAGEWLADHGAFPGDPAFEECIEKAIAGTLDWEDVEKAAA